MTPKQSEVLRVIIDRLDQDGVCPSYDEIKDALGLSSKSRVAMAIDALVDQGFLRRNKYRSRRALVVLRRPGQDPFIKTEELLSMMHELLSGAQQMGTREDTVDLRVNRDLWECLTREVEDMECTAE
jgi:SOS-response transcriptional repressor LexA